MIFVWLLQNGQDAAYIHDLYFVIRTNAHVYVHNTYNRTTQNAYITIICIHDVRVCIFLLLNLEYRYVLPLQQCYM